MLSDLTYKFDIIVQPGLMCGDIEGISMSSVFGLSTTKLSVSLWVRFKTVDPKTILSLYALRWVYFSLTKININKGPSWP